MKKQNKIIFFIVAIAFWACGEPGQHSTDTDNKRPLDSKTAVANRTGNHTPSTPGIAPLSPTPTQSEKPKLNQPTPLMGKPLVIRYQTPGLVRFKIQMPNPIEFIRWSPLAGLVVSSGNYVHNVTSKGIDRWRVVAGKGHQLFVVDDQEVLWSPEFKKISQLRRHGRIGWKRPWNAEIVGNKNSRSLFLIDAATIAAVGQDGKDRWRASMDGLRSIEGPFECEGGYLFQSIRGLEGIAVSISDRGSILHETILQRGVIVLGASKSCDPIVWQDGKVSLLDSRGIKRWIQQFATEPIFHRLPNGFLFITSSGDESVKLRILDNNGNKKRNTTLQISGRVTGSGIIPSAKSVLAMGLCMDVSSPCAKPGGNRGPYNTLLMMGRNGNMSLMTRHISGHMSLLPYPDKGFISASSEADNQTEVTRRDENGAIIWTKTIPGRMSSNPAIGPEGEIYVGTCQGWDCRPPHSLMAITGIEPEETDEEDSPRPPPSPKNGDSNEIPAPL